MIYNYSHNYVYRIVNNLNGMEYIGVHSTDNLNDGYFGSGTYLKNAIKKYGKSNFTKQIIQDFQDRQSALNKERELVNPDYVRNKSVYNLVLGGNVPIGRTLSIKKFTKWEQSQLFIDFNKIEEANNDCKLDYEGEKLIFYPDKNKTTDYKNWLSEAERHKIIYSKVTKDDPTQWAIRMLISNFIIDHIDDACQTLTNCYNDNRNHETAMKFIEQLHRMKWLGDYVLVKRMDEAA